jgi:hypothetical protein
MSKFTVHLFNQDNPASFMPVRQYSPTTAHLVARQWVKKSHPRKAILMDEEGNPTYEIRSTPHRGFYISERLELTGGEAQAGQCDLCGHPRHEGGLCMTVDDCMCGAEVEREYVN